MTDTHPETDELKAFLHHCDSPEYAALRLHLAQCVDCREEVDTLESLQRHYHVLKNEADADLDSDNHLAANHLAANNLAANNLSDEQQQMICDYIDGRLQADEKQQVEALIQSNSYAKKSALHYSSHRAVMSAEIPVQLQDSAPGQDTDPNSQGTSMFSELLNQVRQWLNFEAPVWAAVPATALTVMVAVFAFQSYENDTNVAMNKTLTVASYQDNPVMQFRSSELQPGIGFFNKAGKFSKPYGNVSVQIVDNSEAEPVQLQLQWPEVDSASQYSMRLQVFKQGEKVTLGVVNSDTAEATYTVDGVSHNRRYEWVLSGNTVDNKTFYSSGGFIIQQKR